MVAQPSSSAHALLCGRSDSPRRLAAKTAAASSPGCRCCHLLPKNGHSPAQPKTRRGESEALEDRIRGYCPNSPGGEAAVEGNGEGQNLRGESPQKAGGLMSDKPGGQARFQETLNISLQLTA